MVYAVISWAGPFSLQALGTAPKWCSFLDNLTEELEENTAAMGKRWFF